ncbi:MAG: HEPN domain-containing protein [Candidatus Bipolaricaulota bacterium]|nr:HEPN domain-containing protein [Candidatus Bipolaricaulota bacterium]
MPSRARANLDSRLTDIDQLFQAHKVLTQFKRAEAAANSAGGGLQKLTAIINALVNAPRRGRPAEVAALNRGAFVLLCSHLQGFVEDLHEETAQHTLAGKARSIGDVVKLVRPRNSNPHPDVIEQMFCGIGIYDIMDAPHWNKCANETVRKRLTGYIELRNKIAHGTRLPMHKSKADGFRKFVVLFADALDQAVAAKIQHTTGTAPW